MPKPRTSKSKAIKKHKSRSKAKPPKFSSTKISAKASATQIGDLVVRFGASQFGARYDEFGNPIELDFVMKVPSIGDVPVRVKPRIDGLAARYYKPQKRENAEADQRKKVKAREKAIRVAWRQTKAYVELMLEMYDNGIRPFHEAFMADVMLPANSGGMERVGDAFVRGHLGPGKDSDARD